MKTINYLIVCVLIITAIGCDTDNNDTPSGETAIFAVPVIRSLAEIRANVSVSSPQETDADGKIYVTDEHLFYIAQEEGVHIFDNSDPSNPQNIAFLNINGVHDIAVKNDRLYADNFVDMLVFDISNIQNITLVQTVENVVTFYPQFPTEAEFYDYMITPASGEIMVGYELQTRERPMGDILTVFEDATSGAPGSNGGVGTGGSYARFQINNNALYTVDSYQLNVFNITDPENAFYVQPIYLNMWMGGGEFETLYMQKEYLFVGSTQGMYVVDASDEFNPFFLSGFSHATACDPVVVSAATAYITVRGGNSCGAIEDQINVIDVTDMANPTLISTTFLDQPYGLGVNANVLYVCCGTGGLKVYDAANSAELVLENSYDEHITDVIPLESHLIAVGPNKIIQYSYGANFTLTQISEVNF